MLNRTPLHPRGLWQGTMIIRGSSFLIGSKLSPEKSASEPTACVWPIDYRWWLLEDTIYITMGSKGQGRVGTETGPGQYQLLTEIFWPERGGIMHFSENVSNSEGSPPLFLSNNRSPLLPTAPHSTPRSEYCSALLSDQVIRNVSE